MLLTPRKQAFSNILVNSLASLIAGIIGTTIIVILTFLISNYFDVVGVFNNTGLGVKISPLFPFILSIITLLGTTITSFLTYHILNMTDSEKYKKNSILFGQLAFFQVISYIMVTPLYMYTGTGDFSNIMYVYLFHTLLIVFGTSLILEIFNNYRYILLGLYGSLIGLFFSIIFSVYVFGTFGSGYARMIILILLLPISSFIVIFMKQLFEYIYGMYYTYTSLDPLGDIYNQIEIEEEQAIREEEEKNTI